jgi:hypothetical protein
MEKDKKFDHYIINGHVHPMKELRWKLPFLKNNNANLPLKNDCSCKKVIAKEPTSKCQTRILSKTGL